MRIIEILITGLIGVLILRLLITSNNTSSVINSFASGGAQLFAAAAGDNRLTR